MRNPIALYLLLAFGISWSIALLAFLADLEYGNDMLSLVVGALFMMGPAIAAFIVRRWVEHAPLMPLGLSLRDTDWRWMGITALAGISILPLALAYNALLGTGLGLDGFGYTEVSTEMMKRSVSNVLKEQGLEAATAQLDVLDNVPGWAILVLILLAGVAAAATVNLPFMFGEEFGWRGFLYHHTRSWKFMRAALFTGVVWGLWHAPLIVQGHNYPGHPWSGVWMMTLFTTVLAIPFALVRMCTRSVWGPCLLHGIINATAGGMLYFTHDGHVMLASVAGVSGLLAIMTITGALLLLARERTGTSMS